MKDVSLRTLIFPFAGNPNYWCMGLLFGIALFAGPAASRGQGYATIRGSLQGLDGEPVPGGKVVAVNTHTKVHRVEHPDPQGFYLMGDVAPGSYVLVACDSGSYEVAKAIEIQLSAGDNPTVPFQLRRLQSARTRVRGKLNNSIAAGQKKGRILLEVEDCPIAQFPANGQSVNLIQLNEYRFEDIAVRPEYQLVVEIEGQRFVAGKVPVDAARGRIADIYLHSTSEEKPGGGLAELVLEARLFLGTEPLPSEAERTFTTSAGTVRTDFGGGNASAASDTNPPGVTTGAGGSVGQSAQGLQINVDGGTANDTLVSQSTPTVNVSTVQGIEIIQGDYQSVQTGGSAGNKIFVFTRRGTNAYHGAAAYWGRNDALDARNFFNLPDFDTLRNHNASAQLGGPLWKDKAFFFGSYQLIRGVQAPTFSPVLTSQLSALNQALLRLGLPAENLRRFVTDQRSDSPLIRIDYQPNDKHSLWWRYGFEGTEWRKDFVGGINAPSSARDFSGRNHLFGFRHEWSVSQSFHVETGYSYLHDSATLAPVEANQVSLLIPGVALLGRTTSLVEGDGYRQRHHLISENLTIAQGRHTLRFGGLFGRDQNLFRFATFQSGRAIVPGLTALSAIPPRADLFQIGAGGSEVSFSVSALEFYAQDDFRLTPRVTLNLGLRYKAELPPSFQVKDTNGWQPRIGLAWVRDRNSKTVVRMGYGVYRGYIPQLPIGFGMLQGGGFQSGAPPPVRRVSSYVGNLAASNALNQFLTTGRAPPGPQLATFSDRTSTGSLTQNVSLTLQRQLTSRLTLEVSYLYSGGTHLLTSTNVNLPPPTIINGRPDFGNGALNPNFAQVYEFRTIGKSFYHSGTAGIRMPSYNGLSLSAYYTFSKSIDDVPLGSYEATPENVFDRRSERSVSDFNLAHNFSLSTAWEVPQPHSKRFEWVRSWFGRPEISGVLLLRSGSYFNVLAGSDANHDGNPLTDRPLGVSRNTFLGPKFAQLDIRAASRYFVLKEVKEGMELGWTVDFFNLLNRANFTNINTVLGQTDLTGVDPRIVFGRNGLPSFDYRSPLTPSGFGLATTAATPRRIQFGLKLSF